MSRFVMASRLALMAASVFCCLGLAAQEADEHVAAGSVFEINKAEVGLEDDFTVKPKAWAIYTHPVTKKEGMKASAKFLHGLGTDTAGFEWTKRIPLYDKKLLSGANKLATFTATWLEDNADQNQPLPLALGLTSKQVPENVLARTLHLAPPLIYDVDIGGEYITITGLWFGTGKPKVWMEYLNAKNAVKRLKCKVENPDGEDGRVNAKLKPVYMNPVDGTSKVVVLTPKLPKGVASFDDLSHVVLDSGSGLAAATELYGVTFDLDGKGERIGGGELLQAVKHGQAATEPEVQANAGWTYTGWDRAFGHIVEPILVTALYDVAAYTLTYTAGPHGTVDGLAQVTQTVSHGSGGTIVTAIPDAHHHFTSWSDGLLTAARQETSVTADLAVTANFAINTYTVTYTAGPNGLVNGAAQVTQLVAHGADGPVVTPQPSANHHFVDWSDGSTADPRQDLSVTGPLAVTANFAITTFLITGTVSGDVAANVTVTLSGDAAMTTTTGIGGDYSFEVPVGNYTVTPSQGDYVFTPSNRDVAITDADSNGNDFTAFFAYLVLDLPTGQITTSTKPADLLTNADYKTTKMVFRRIPAGTFTMGSPEDELGRLADREFQHQVTLTEDFYIGVFEVTQAQYYQVMGTWPSYFNNPTYRDTRPVEQVNWNTIRGGTWPNGDPGADTFMDKLRTLTGAGHLFDLPTDAQLEYACRAGTTTALNSGSNLTNIYECPNMTEVGRYLHNGGSDWVQNGDLSVGSAAVGSYPPNAWGLYDMHGNVWEWCLDGDVANLGVDPVVDPVGGDTGSYRVMRGGSWADYAESCRSAVRIGPTPSTSYNYLGLRAAIQP